MIAEDASLEEIIRAALHYKAIETRNSLPGRIKSYDASKNLAEVEVCINPTIRKDGGDEVEVLGVIKNVPIEWMSGGGYFIAFPLNAGDAVKITFHDFALDEWIERGGVVTVKDQHTHHITDASAYPGMRAKPSALPQAHGSKLIIGKIDNPSLRIAIDDAFIMLSENAANFVALANLVESRLAVIKTWAAVVETAIPAGVFPPISSLSTTMPSVAVAASKVKAE